MINIFAKEAFLNINPSQPLRLRTKPIRGGHVQRVSSMIRGDQIAERLGARLNPNITDIDLNKDVNIYVKPRVQKGTDFKFEGRINWLDIVDGHNLGQVLIKHPDVGCIVCSETDGDTMKSVIPNEVIYIPQHHCNFERQRRNAKEVKRIGMIGTEDAWQFIPYELERELKQRGIELVKFSRFFKREDIISFYMSIDLQLVWRPYKKLLSNPLKIVNAASFGIPTVALDEPTFKEVSDCYFRVQDLRDLLVQIDILKEHRGVYENISQKCIERSEFYHINNVAEMYRKLDI